MGSRGTILRPAFSTDRSLAAVFAGCRLASSILLACCIAACVGDCRKLNSERIAQTFADYHLELIESKDNIRVSNLYSEGTTGAVCRTLAVARLTDRIDAEIRLEHGLISDGASIGSVFKGRGWDLDKRHRYIGEIEMDAQSTRITRLMKLESPVSAAIHIYDLSIRKKGRSHDYATIAEVHHPACLTSAMLLTIYGSAWSGQKNRDDVRQIVELVGAKLREPISP